jgi:hypothetical protein
MKFVNYEEIAKTIGYSYLNGGSFYWEDGCGNIKSYDSMNTVYLDNCIKFVERGIEKVKNSENDLDIKRRLSMLNDISIEEVSEKQLKKAQKEIINILKKKLNELKGYRKSRN